MISVFKIFLLTFQMVSLAGNKFRSHEQLHTIALVFLEAYCLKNNVAQNTDMRLKSDILCDYDNQKRPTLNSTPINLKYILRNYDYVSSTANLRFFYIKVEISSTQTGYSSTLTLQARILQQWNDSRLAWEPKDYDNITSTLVSSEYLWTPSLFLGDSHIDYGLASCKPTFCYIKNTGEIVCKKHRRCRFRFFFQKFIFQACSLATKPPNAKETS